MSNHVSRFFQSTCCSVEVAYSGIAVGDEICDLLVSNSADNETADGLTLRKPYTGYPPTRYPNMI